MHFEHGGRDLGRIHKKNNDKKFFCHFTGFLEGILASGYIELAEVRPLLAECEEFVSAVSDGDAKDIIEDFEIDLLEFSMISDAVEFRSREIDVSCEKSSVNRFLGLCRGIVCDGVISTKEAKVIVDQINSSAKLQSQPGIKQIFITCIDALEDGIVSSDESIEICEAISDVVGDCYSHTGLAQTTGVSNFREGKIGDSSNLEGAIVVLTGNFTLIARQELKDRLLEFGAIVPRHVSGKTDFLVVGGEASRDWVEMNRGTKIKMALQLRLSAKNPVFLSESQIVSELL